MDRGRRFNSGRRVVRREWWCIGPPYHPLDGADRVFPNVHRHCAQSDHGHHHVQLLTDTRHLALGDTLTPQGLDQVIHPPCGYPFHVGLLDHSQQSSLAATPWLQQAREVAPLSKLRDVQIHNPYPGIPRPGPIPVALGHPLRAAFSILSLDWSADTPIGDWQWVWLGSRPVGHVRDIILDNLGLTGSIPKAFAGLERLRRLDLDGNDLTGGIPPELGELSNLVYLYLLGKDLSGEIPGELGRLSNLEMLDIRGNRLTGVIPAALGDLDSLRLLNLNNNDLTGSIPVKLGDMDSLTDLWLRDNSLSGGIPQELEDLNLTALHLSGNSFSGCIPSGLRDVETNDLNLLGLDYCTSPES